MSENNKENCHELSSIKYKTMLLQGEITSSTETILNIEELLEQETVLNKLEPWCKLDKTQKLNKLKDYTSCLKKRHELSLTEEKDLFKYLSSCLERKQLNKVKDVLYDKELGEIKNIPQLIFNNSSRRFILKKCDKHVSTIKCLSVKKSSISLSDDLKKLEITDKIDT
jgi:hypothetical protein